MDPLGAHFTAQGVGRGRYVRENQFNLPGDTTSKRWSLALVFTHPPRSNSSGFSGRHSFHLDLGLPP